MIGPPTYPMRPHHVEVGYPGGTKTWWMLVSLPRVNFQVLNVMFYHSVSVRRFDSHLPIYLSLQYKSHELQSLGTNNHVINTSTKLHELTKHSIPKVPTKERLSNKRDTCSDCSIPFFLIKIIIKTTEAPGLLIPTFPLAEHVQAAATRHHRTEPRAK